MSHDRGCYRCGREGLSDYEACPDKDCVKKDVVENLRSKDTDKQTIERLESKLRAQEQTIETFRQIIRESKSPYFICGNAGEVDTMGLPKVLMICPAQGLDGFAVYEMKRPYSAPGW